MVRTEQPSKGTSLRAVRVATPNATMPQRECPYTHSRVPRDATAQGIHRGRNVLGLPFQAVPSVSAGTSASPADGRYRVARPVPNSGDQALDRTGRST